MIERDASGAAFTDFDLGAPYEGPPGHVHGGVSALVLDHVLGEAASDGETPRFTGTITMRYLRTTKLGRLHAEAHIDRTEGVKTYVVGHLADEDGITVEAEGVFITPTVGPRLNRLLTGHRQVEPLLGRDQVVVAVLADIELHPLDLTGEAVAGRPVVR